MVESRDVEFEVEGGDRLRGWLFTPATGLKSNPAVSMAHGYAGVKEHGLRRFAQAFAEAGFVVPVHDHRNFGASDGTVRHTQTDLQLQLSASARPKEACDHRGRTFRSV